MRKAEKTFWHLAPGIKAKTIKVKIGRSHSKLNIKMEVKSNAKGQIAIV